MVNLELYQKALLFAAEAHKGQLRKGSDVPYITHPVGVSAILAQYNAGGDVVVAGLLHDTLEDTKMTREELEAHFGSLIAGLVAEVSEEKLANGQEVPWEVRKRQQLDRLRNADLDVVRLKAADVVHNVRSILRDLRVVGEKVWERFNRPRETELEHYRETAELLHSKLGDEPLALDLLEVVAELQREGKGGNGC